MNKRLIVKPSRVKKVFQILKGIELRTLVPKISENMVEEEFCHFQRSRDAFERKKTTWHGKSINKHKDACVVIRGGHVHDGIHSQV